jgi:hypothetical protein
MAARLSKTSVHNLINASAREPTDFALDYAWACSDEEAHHAAYISRLDAVSAETGIDWRVGKRIQGGAKPTLSESRSE